MSRMTTKTELVVQRVPEDIVATLKKINGVTDVKAVENGSNRLIVESEAREDLMAEVSKAVVGKNAGLIRMTPVQLALEDYYLGLIGGRRTS